MPQVHLSTTNPYSADAALPVSVVDFKAFARITTISEDALIRTFIVAATRQLEKRTRRAFVEQTCTLKIDATANNMGDYALLRSIMGSRSIIYLGSPPIISVTSVVFYDEDNTATTVDAADYFVDTSLGRIIPVDGATWPTSLRSLQAVVVTYKAGYVAATAGNTLDADLINAIKMYTNHLYAHRGGECGMPELVESLVDSYRFNCIGRPYMGFDFNKITIRSGALEGGY